MKKDCQKTRNERKRTHGTNCQEGKIRQSQYKQSCQDDVKELQFTVIRVKKQHYNAISKDIKDRNNNRKFFKSSKDKRSMKKFCISAINTKDI